MWDKCLKCFKEHPGGTARAGKSAVFPGTILIVHAWLVNPLLSRKQPASDSHCQCSLILGAGVGGGSIVYWRAQRPNSKTGQNNQKLKL